MDLNFLVLAMLKWFQTDVQKSCIPLNVRPKTMGAITVHVYDFILLFR